MALRGPTSRLLRTLLGHTRQQSRSQSVTVIGAPFSRGQKIEGVEDGPSVIRSAGLIDRLSLLDMTRTTVIHDYIVHDMGDLNFHYPENDEPYKGVKFPRTVGGANKKLSTAVSRGVAKGHTIVVLGGDHSIGLGSAAGHAQQCPDLCLIWVDAHPDLNTPQTSPSGNLHGQPVAFMLKELQSKIPDLPGFSWVKPFLSSTDLVYIGLRDVDPGEYKIMKDLGIQYFAMRDIDRLGIQRVMEMTLDHLVARKQRPIHLSFDIDAFDPSLAPATGTPVNGGMTYREGIYLAEEIHNTGLLSVMDLVEVNPQLGASEEAVLATASLAVDVIASSLGQTREGAHLAMIPSKKKDTDQLCL